MDARLKLLLLFFPSLLVFGTAGYMVIERWSVFDSLYMTIITISTVGYGELRPLSQVGKGFTSILILLGVGSLAFVASKMAEYLVEERVFHSRRIRMTIDKVQNHVIVCGFGRMGQTVVQNLRARGAPVVVIEKDPEVIRKIDEMGVLYLEGDATDDAVLQTAHVERARALASVLPGDAENLFITITARGLNPGLNIISRASWEKNESKMISAGATRVLNPYRNGGRLMVRQLLHPSVTEFMDAVTDIKVEGLALEEVQIQSGSRLDGVALKDSPIRSELDLIVVAVKQGSARMRFNPPSGQVLGANDVLVVLGAPPNLARMSELAEGS